MGTPEIKRIPQLDGIRGLAILLVMLFHFFWFPMAAGLPISANDSWLRPILLSCWVGVDLFFVLSGFLITGILVDARARPGYFKNFYARRVLRIFPLYYLFLAAWLALTGYQSLWLWSYTANIHMAREGWTAVPSAVDHLWSLAIEEQYYLLWPVVIYFLKPKQALFVCAGLAMLCPLIRFHYFHVNQPLSAYMLTHARLDSLAWGALLALAVRVCPPSRRLLGGVALFSRRRCWVWFCLRAGSWRVKTLPPARLVLAF